MYIAGKVTECDFSGKTYDKPVEGAHALARGATGRVCCVMYVGPEYLAEQGIKLSTREEAERWAESVQGGSVDF